MRDHDVGGRRARRRPAGPAPRKRRRAHHTVRTAWSRRVLWISLVAALVPIVAAAAHLGADGWTPEGETAVLARRTKAVLSSRPPLIGVVSTSDRVFRDDGGTGAAADKVYHPGPLEHYLLALPYAASGWSPVGLLVGVVLIDGAAAGLAVWLSWRRLGAVGAAAAALAAIAIAQTVGTATVASTWNPSIVVFPVWAALVGLWAVLDGDDAGVVPAVAFASLAAQSHLASLPIGAAVLLVLAIRLVAGEVVAAREAAAGPRARRVAARRRRRRLLVGGLAGATLLVAWLPPLVQQLTDSPGNLGRLGGLVTGDGGGRGGLGLPARILTGVLTTLRLPGGDPISVNDSVLWRLEPISLLRVVVVLVAVGATAWAAWSRRDRSLGLLLATFGGAVVVAFAGLSRVGTEAIPVPDIYLLRWVVGVAALGWTAAAVALVDTFRHQVQATRVFGSAERATGGERPVAGPAWFGGRVVGAERVVAGGALALLAWALAVSLPATGYDRADLARNVALTQGVRRDLPEGPYLVEARGYAGFTVEASTVALDLEVHGYDIALPTTGARRDETLPPPVAEGSRPRLVVDSSGEDLPEGARVLFRRDVPPEEARRLAEVERAFGAPGVTVAIDRAGVDQLVPASPELRRPIDALIANLAKPEVRRLIPSLVTNTDPQLRSSLLGLMTVDGVPDDDLAYLRTFEGTSALVVWLAPA